MSTTLGKNLLDKYEIHMTIHGCSGKSCETRLGIWDLYRVIIERENA
jgi:hypothetical protein